MKGFAEWQILFLLPFSSGIRGKEKETTMQLMIL
jgi:hypothetical protein